MVGKRVALSLRAVPSPVRSNLLRSTTRPLANAMEYNRSKKRSFRRVSITRAVDWGDSKGGGRLTDGALALREMFGPGRWPYSETKLGQRGNRFKRGGLLPAVDQGG